jgi:hypothetical protein
LIRTRGASQVVAHPSALAFSDRFVVLGCAMESLTSNCREANVLTNESSEQVRNVFTDNRCELVLLVLAAGSVNYLHDILTVIDAVDGKLRPTDAVASLRLRNREQFAGQVQRELRLPGKFEFHAGVSLTAT